MSRDPDALGQSLSTVGFFVPFRTSWSWCFSSTTSIFRWSLFVKYQSGHSWLQLVPSFFLANFDKSISESLFENYVNIFGWFPCLSDKNCRVKWHIWLDCFSWHFLQLNLMYCLHHLFPFFNLYVYSLHSINYSYETPWLLWTYALLAAVPLFFDVSTSRTFSWDITSVKFHDHRVCDLISHFRLRW